jgi:hypothetical protein
VWPDEPDHVARLRAAIELALTDPPVVVRGDALELLARLAGPDDDLHLVIWHSWVLAYRTPATQRALAEAIDPLGARRDRTWIRLERPSQTPGPATPVLAGVEHDHPDCALVTVVYRGGPAHDAATADVPGTRTTCAGSDERPAGYGARLDATSTSGAGSGSLASSTASCRAEAIVKPPEICDPLSALMPRGFWRKSM